MWQIIAMMKINLIPETMKFYRAMRGLTLQDIADQLEVAVSTVGRWERGECEPSANDANNLARALKISLSTLVEGKKVSNG